MLTQINSNTAQRRPAVCYHILVAQWALQHLSDIK